MLFRSELGQPYGGFPKELQDIILKGESPITGRPNDHIPAIDFDAEFAKFQLDFPFNEGFLEYLSYKMYPKVYEEFYKTRDLYGDMSKLPTQAFFYGLKPDEEIMINIDEGKDILVKLLFVSEPDEQGLCTVSFDLNGQNRRIKVKNEQVKVSKPQHQKIGKTGDVGTPLQGRLARIMVKSGEVVKANAPLFIIEAMKMESIVSASSAGKILNVVLSEGSLVEQDDLVLTMET